MPVILELFLIVTCLVQSSKTEVVCDKNATFQDWNTCFRVYEMQNLYDTAFDDKYKWKKICKSSECLIQCVTDVMSDCVKTKEVLDGGFAEYDVDKVKLYYRFACSEISRLKKLKFCAFNQTCSGKSYSLSESQYLDLYKTRQICKQYAKLRQCVTVSPSENCTESDARSATVLSKIQYSLRTLCGNEDMSHIYNMYDGDARCTDPKVESKCFESRVTSRITRCSALSLRTLVDQRLPPNIIDFCDRQECNIKCYEDAVSLCSMKDQYVELDPVAVKVSYRVSCDKKEELKTAVAECTIRNMTCSADFQDLQTEANKLLQHTNNTAYRQALCRATSKFLECLDYVVAGNCTNEMATLMKDIMTVAFSYAKCGPQDHAYFSKYGGDTKCVTSGSWKSMISILLFGMTALLLVRL